MDNIITMPATGCVVMGHIVRAFCLPVKKLCDNTVPDGLLSECDKLWNCSPVCAGDTPYFIPVPEDGTFMLQTNFNGSGEWGSWINIVLTDHMGTVINSLSENDFGVRWMTGRSKKHSYQTIEIDVSAIDMDCFGFKITSTSGHEVCTQIYRKEKCSNLVEVEGLMSGHDCWNNYYGDPVGAYTGTSFKYSNKIYLKGMAKYYGGSTDLDDDVIKEYTRVHPSEKIAPFMMRYLFNKILSTEKVKVNGAEYRNDGSGTFNPVGSGTMFFPIMEFYTTCTTSGAACD